MAKGYLKHQEHKDQVALLGKTLIRRCGRKCELCESGNTSLSVVEVEPTPETPHEDNAVMVCESCQHSMETGKMDSNAMRFLESIIWTDVPPVQVTAVRLCRLLAKNGVSWASDILDSVHLHPQVKEWLEGE